MKTESFWTWFDEHARPKLGVRAKTFARMFEHLEGFNRPVTVIETGCCRRDPADPEAWRGDGCSTVLFDRYARDRADGSAVFSVDLDADAVRAARRHVGPDARTMVMCADSVDWLRQLAVSWIDIGSPEPDLLYLDSFDYDASDPIPSAIHHHAELMAALPMIREDTLVVVDDSPASFDDVPRAEISGKGFLVARHMLLCGAVLEFSEYQAGWTRVAPPAARGDEDLTKMVDRARALVEDGRTIAAEQVYRLVLGMTTPPRTGRERIAHGDACAFYGRLAVARQKLGVAADWFREAIQADPLATDYRLDVVTNCHLAMGNMKAALQESERATKIEPDYPRAWHVLGGVHHEAIDARKCVDAYDEQLRLAPNDSDARLDRAVIALDLADYETAGALAEAVILDDPERAADAIHCKAMIAYRRHDHETAIALYDTAIEGGCRDPGTAHWNKSLALHSIGRYREGWVEHEHREHNLANPALYLPMRRFTLPRWTGREPARNEDGSSKLIHVHAEAGAGDNLALLRYLPLLEERGFRVRFEALDGMAELVAQSFPAVEVVPRAVDYPGALGIRPFDYHLPVGSLPAVFETGVDDVPWRGPYLLAEEFAAETVAAALLHASQRDRRVGFCWSSGIRDTGIWIREYGLRKSMPFETIKPLACAAWKGGALPVSLQVGPERAQQRGYLIDVLPERPTWAETAALVANLDLVVTVDTGVAHLAGAMGKETWLLCQRDGASWHFMSWRPGAPWNEASPWYPTMRIFRQEQFDQPHVWSDVIREALSALEARLAAPAAAE